MYLFCGLINLNLIHMRVLILFALLLSASTTYAQHSFRNTDWNMTKAQVIASEKRKPSSQTPTSLTYENMTVGGLRAGLVYKFTKIGLVQAAYIFAEPHSSEAAYYKDYTDVQLAIAMKYEAPTVYQENWTNELYKGDRENYGLAAAAGHVTFLNEWVVGNTLIKLIFTGDNFKTNLGAIYNYRFAPQDVPAILNTKDF